MQGHHPQLCVKFSSLHGLGLVALPLLECLLGDCLCAVCPLSTSWLQFHVLQTMSAGHSHSVKSLSGSNCTLAKSFLGYFYRKGWHVGRLHIISQTRLAQVASGQSVIWATSSPHGARQLSASIPVCPSILYHRFCGPCETTSLPSLSTIGDQGVAQDQSTWPACTQPEYSEKDCFPF